MRGRRNTSLSLSPPSFSSPSSVQKSQLHKKSNSLNSLPPSPLLPFPVVTKENRLRPRPRPRFWSRYNRLIVAVCGLLMLWCLLPRHQTTDVVNRQPGGRFRAVAETVQTLSSSLPKSPTTLALTTKSGAPRWAIWIPPNATFPLPGHDYDNLCMHGLAHHNNFAVEDPSPGWLSWFSDRPGKSTDMAYIDVHEAEQAGVWSKLNKSSPRGVCETSLTFLLDANDAGFGKTLLSLWLSYGYAKANGRSFFIDDSRWAWGKYGTFFKPPPTPACSRPSAHYVVPYPLNAAHLVVSSSTAPLIYGPSFRADHLDTHRRGRSKYQRIYDMLRTGYEALFHLSNEEDKAYLHAQVTHIKTFASQGTPVVGMQVRRGDRRPFEPQYSRDYLPLERYVAAAHQLFIAPLSSPPSKFLDRIFPPPPQPQPATELFIASDDPTLIDSPDLHFPSLIPHPTIRRTQERIQLATKAQLDRSSPIVERRAPGTAYVKHLDENSGWEGGFFPGLFFSTGASSYDPSAHNTVSISAVPPQALFMRELVGRAYLLDLGVLVAAAEHGSGVVCAKSTATCRAIAVMMGQENFEKGRWVNVDAGPGWSWDGAEWWE